MSERVVIYVYGFFDSPKQSEWPSAQTWVNDIIASDFTHVILASFHVDQNGNLYGSVPVVTDGALASGVDPSCRRSISNSPMLVSRCSTRSATRLDRPATSPTSTPS